MSPCVPKRSRHAECPCGARCQTPDSELHARVCWPRVGKLWRASSKTLTGFLGNSCQCVIFSVKPGLCESCRIQCGETTDPAEPSRSPALLLDSANLLQLLSLGPLDPIGVGQLWLKYLKIQKAFNTSPAVLAARSSQFASREL